MLPSQSLQNINPMGHTHQGLVDDISTRSLQSVRLGEGAGKISTGLANAFVGYEAGRFHSGGSYDTFVGYQSGYQNTAASYGTFVGAFAGAYNERGEENVFVGFRTGEQNTSGSECVGVGAYAMRYNASGNYSVSVGYAAGERCIDGSFNTMIGAQSGQDNRSGSYNTMAGYRSGRSAFQGNYNTYFGAYAGYSNYHGDANCFIGYRSGESLANGSFNIAIGAYSLAFASEGDSNISIGPYAALYTTGSGNIYFGQNAGASNITGDFNIIIGVNAGLSNLGSKNVVIGESSAPVWNGDCNVLIGAEVAKIGSGYQCVIIGYQAASHNYQNGINNIFIGDGSDATRSNVNNAISIGTFNVTTTSDTIAVGKNIENTGVNSVSLGFDIQTNAQNSVLVGEALTITSATYFNDPLNLEITTTIANDAYLKFGISNILYTNGILGTLTAPFATAEFGYNTSNLYNSITNPTKYRTSPSRYNLSDRMGYSGLITGCNLFYTSPACNETTPFNQTLAELTASNLYIQGYPFSLSSQATPVVAAPSYASPLRAYASNQSRFYSDVTFGNLGIGTTFVQNVFSVNDYTYQYPLTVPKRHLFPVLSNETLPTLDYPNPTDGIYLDPAPSDSNVIVLRPPRYGTLDATVVRPSEWPPTYTLTTPQLFASNDTATLLAAVSLYDVDSNLTGVSSNAESAVVYTFPLPATATALTTLTPKPFIASIQTTIVPLTSNELVVTQYGQWAAASNVVFDGFDPAFTFYDAQTHPPTAYTCNQALHIPNFPTTTVTYPIDVDSNTATFIYSGSNDPLYIGNTYVFQQFAPSNLDLQWRFACNADGAGDSDYTSNVTFSGTPGLDGTTTLLVTAETPNPLYYYASNQVGYGGSNVVLPIPTSPLTVPYASVLAGSNYFLWDTQAPPPTESFRFTVETCNVQIPFQSYTQWEDPLPTVPTASNTSHVLTHPYTLLPSPTFAYSNLFVEQYPSAGRLQLPPTSTYQPLNPWETTTDHIQYLLGSNATYKRFTWSPTVTPGIYQSSNAWIRTPTTTTFQTSNDTLLSLTTSNEPLTYTTLYTSNIISTTGATQTLPTRIVVSPLATYDDTSIGQPFVTSNETQQSNLAVLSGTPGSNQTVVIHETSNIDIDFSLVSNIQYQSNVVSVQYDGTPETDPYNVLTITFFQTNVTTHHRLYNSNLLVYRQWDDQSNVYDGLRNTYLYTYSNTYPYVPATSNLLSSNELANGATTLLYTYSNTDIQRTFREDRAVYPLHRTVLYQSNTDFITSPSSDYRVLQSNVGIVAGFHTSNLIQDHIYLEPISASYVGIPTYTTLVTALPVPYFTSNLPFQRQTLPDYAQRTGAQWLEMNTRFQASLAEWETAARSLVNLSFTPTHLYIIHIQKGAIVQPTTGDFIHRLPLPLTTATCVYQATGHYDLDNIEFFYVNETTQQVSPVFLQTVFVRFAPSLWGNAQDYAISYHLAQWNPFTSNVFYVTAPEYPSSNLFIRFNVKNAGDPLDFYEWPSKATFPLGIVASSNLSAANVYLTPKNTPPVALTSNAFTYTIHGSYANASAAINAVDSGTFTIPTVPFYDYPSVTNDSNLGTLASIRFLQLPHCNVWTGTASNALASYVEHEGTFQPEHLAFLQTRPMTHGFLATSHFVSSNIDQSDVYYYPYQPDLVPNETLAFRWLYQGIASPEYELTYLNHWLLASPQPITPQRTYAPTRRVLYDDHVRFPASTGWEASAPTLSSIEYTYPYHSNLSSADSNTASLSYTSIPLSASLPSTVTFVPVAYSYPPTLLTSSITLSVEQASDISLSALVGSNVIQWDSNHTNDLLVYLDQPPTRGLLLHSNVSAWRYQDLADDQVRYQHLGDSNLTDQFRVRFATTDYNVGTTALTVQLTIEPLPRLIDQRRDAIYALSSNEAVQTHYSFQSSMTFSTPAAPVATAAYLHVLQTSNLTTEFAHSPCNVLPLSLMSVHSNTYRLTSDAVSNIHDPPTMTFALRTRSDPTPHRLTDEPLYSNLIVYDWASELNQFVSSNLLIPPILANNEQKVEYQLDVQSSNYPSMLEDQETSFSFYTQPNTSFFPASSNARVLFDPFLDFGFRVEFQDSNAQDIAAFQVSRFGVTAFSQTYPIPPALRDTIVFNEYTYWSFVFNDSANESGLSLYINPNTSLPNKDNQATNVFKDISLTPSLSNVATIRIVSDADHPKNFYPSLTSNLSWPTLQSYVELHDYDHRLYFKNVELVTRSATNQTTDILNDTYNIALGKNIQIRGEDNICFGTNFSTLGKYSIIIGNNIGQSANLVNQVYESIIIGNTSFQGSIIRNVIAIGSSLMNDLYAGALPGLTDQIINQFISKRPILIGNDIGPEKVDYHVNLANTLMRTSVGNSNLDQIYLGNSGEMVAVGYASNAYLQGPAQLYVNGDVQTDAIQYHFAESAIYGTEASPIQGGTFVIDPSQTSRVVFELASNASGAPTPLTLDFLPFGRNVGKEFDFVLNERSSVPRSLTISSNVRFAVPRPTQTTPSGIDRLQCWAIQSNLALGTYTSNAAYY